jgi:hypothetical protein
MQQLRRWNLRTDRIFLSALTSCTLYKAPIRNRNKPRGLTRGGIRGKKDSSHNSKKSKLFVPCCFVQQGPGLVYMNVHKCSLQRCNSKNRHWEIEHVLSKYDMVRVIAYIINFICLPLVISTFSLKDKEWDENITENEGRGINRRKEGRF